MYFAPPYVLVQFLVNCIAQVRISSVGSPHQGFREYATSFVARSRVDRWIARETAISSPERWSTRADGLLVEDVNGFRAEKDGRRP